MFGLLWHRYDDGGHLGPWPRPLQTADDHFVAFGKQVGGRRIHRARARSGEHQHVVGRAHHFLQVRQTGAVNLTKIFGAVMNYSMKKRYVPASHRFDERPKLKSMRRDEFTLEEYRKLHTVGRKWIMTARS